MRTILLIAVVAAVAFQQSAALACTAFLAYDGKLALGGNSEDWKDPDTYLWFNPAEKGQYGRVAFGFGNLWPQGGMNDQGLFFDGMMTDPLPLKKTEGKQPRPHDVLDRMMRECAGVDEAVKFLDRFHLPELANAMIFLGDKHGNSAIYEGDEVLRGNGHHQVVTNYYQSRQSAKKANCRRMLKAEQIFAKRFGKDDALTIDLARSVLDAVHQEGKYATKYSNIYDLTNGDIYLYCNHNFDAVVKLNLAKELAKGARTIALPSLFESEAAVAIPEYKPYLGRYVDTAEDRIVTVTEQNGNLSLDVPGQGVLELTSPDKQGRWHLAAAPQVAMSFERAGDGKVNIMKCHKGGFEFDLLREGYTPPIEIDLKQAARYVGKYRSELRSVDFEVRIQNKRLAVYIPGQAIFELHPPGEDGKHRFRAMRVISVAFHDSQEGRVVSMTLYKPGQEEKLPRLDISPGGRGGHKDPGAVAKSPAPTTQPSAPPPAADFVDWAKEKAIRLDSLDWSKTDPTAFAFLDEALKGKRVVFLGEMDHFVAERMEFRLLLIKELARRGFRRIGMEMGLSDGKRMDRFLETGDEKWLDRVALYGYRGDMRKDRNDEVAGWTDESHPEFTQTVLDEAEWFLRQLRKINEGLPAGEPRLKWFGYDLSFRPGGGYADAGELLGPHKEKPLARRIKERMACIPGESRIEEAARLEKLVAMLDANRDELVAMTGEADALELRRSLQRMADAFRFIDGLGDLKDYDPNVVAAALSKRERRMDLNFDEHLAEWPADEKIILLGHALHLSKDSESIQTQNFGLMWKSIGTYLTAKLPGEVYGIWLLHDHGRHGLMHGVPAIQSFRSPQDSVERLLAKVHPILMLPLGSADSRAAWLDKNRTFSHSGAPAHAVLPRQVDCLFFIETANEPGKRRGNALRAQEDDVQALLAKKTPDLRQLNIESFEKVFSIVHDHYWDPKFGGLDWQAVGDELRPQIMKASTLSEARAILRDMISRLKLSHFAIIPTDSRKEAKRPRNDGAPGGETGIDARVIDGKALVTSVAEGSSAERVGVRTGWEIIRINDFDVVASLKRLDRELPDTPSKRVKMAGGMVVRVRSGVGESVAVTFRNGEGDLANLTIPFGEPRGRIAKVGNFGHARVRIDVKTVGDNIGYIAVNKFLSPLYVMNTFNDALGSFMEADGIIIDLRGNSGGKDAMALGMMGWLAPSEWVAGRLRTRGNEFKMIVRPRARTYDGPVAVLTDGLTGSSAEFVAAALQEMGRACVIGTRTKGEALPAEYTKLPNGDVFLYAVADFVTGAGKRLEGVGVTPDIEAALTQGSLLEGRDVVLEAAVKWVRTQD